MASGGGSDSWSGFRTFVGIVSAIFGVAIFVRIVYALIKCAKKQDLPPVYIATHGVAAAAVVTPETCIFMPTMERFIEEMAKEKALRFSPQDLVGFTRNYATRLGSGGFGVVYKGEFPNGVQVAVKVLNRNMDTRVEEQFMAEVGTMGRTYHINLVRLYGFCFDAAVKALVYEYMEKGSLDRYLFDRSSSRVLPLRKLQEIAVGTAKGITYLHEECQQRIIHYDIKPGNVLLDSGFSPKVADFGLAKLYDRAATHVTLTGGRGTPGYAAPELWMPLPVTHKCDVYRFGMLLFEVVGRRRNFNTELPDSQEWLPRWVWEKFDKGLLEGAVSQQLGVEEQDSEEAVRMAKVALWCVQYLPADRPEMSRVVKMLEGEVEVAAPPNPFGHLAAVDMCCRRSTTRSSPDESDICNKHRNERERREEEEKHRDLRGSDQRRVDPTSTEPVSRTAAFPLCENEVQNKIRVFPCRLFAFYSDPKKTPKIPLHVITETPQAQRCTAAV